MIMRTILYLLGSLLYTPLVVVGQPCDLSADSDWVRDTYERTTSFDTLAVYAIERFGPPTSCDGSVTQIFDGSHFGRLTLNFPKDVAFRLETFPPESSVATLISPSGFADDEEIRGLLKTYAETIGLEIDWRTPDVAATGNERTETYWDPDDGINASARLTFLDDRLVSVAVSLAL